MKQPLPEEKLEYIKEQLRTKVLEKYSEKQDINSQQTELESSIQALHEMTEMPVEDIRTIANAILHEYETKQQKKEKKKSEKTIYNTSATEHIDDNTVDALTLELENNKRNFYYHLVPFIIVNTMLITLNAVTSDFPWAMFPLFGWSIGLISHYMKDIHWAKRDIEIQRKYIRTNAHQILLESIDCYPQQKDRILNGVYRLLTSGCRLSELEQYLYGYVGSDEKRQAENAAYQLIKIRDNFIEKQSENEKTNYRNKHRRRR